MRMSAFSVVLRVILVMFKYFLPILALSTVLMFPPISLGYPGQPGQASPGYYGQPTMVSPGYGPTAVTSDGSVIHITPDKAYIFPNPDEGMYFDNEGIGSPYGYLPDTATSSVDFDIVDCDYCVGIGGQEVPSDLYLSRQKQQAQGHYNQPDEAPPPGYPGAGVKR